MGQYNLRLGREHRLLFDISHLRMRWDKTYEDNLKIRGFYLQYLGMRLQYMASLLEETARRLGDISNNDTMQDIYNRVAMQDISYRDTLEDNNNIMVRSSILIAQFQEKFST